MSFKEKYIYSGIRMDLRHFLCLVVPFFFLLFLDHQVDGRHSGRLVGKGERNGNSDIVNNVLGSAGGQQGGKMVAEKMAALFSRISRSPEQCAFYGPKSGIYRRC